MNNKGLLGEVVAEIFGTFILVLLGVGVVANVGLAPRMGSPAAFNWLTINIGWCFAVVVAVYTVGRVSGAHLNPAVTLAMALRRSFPWGKVIPFWVAQMIGANLGPLFVGFAVLAVGVSLGGASGYAINPARDLAPRIFAALIGSKGVFDGTYWFIAPIIGPFIGGVLGVLTYDLFVTPYLPG